MIELDIDTTNNKELIVRLLKDGTIISEKHETQNTKADRVLILVEQLCLENDVTINEIKNIKVHRGPGSFTGVRVGVAIANALAFSLGISVNNRKIGEMETPVYS